MKTPLTEAIRKLQLAVTYAEDGGLIDATARAREAIELLHLEHKRRAAILRSLEAKPPAKKRAATKGRNR
jgi:hypothetical protein